MKVIAALLAGITAAAVFLGLQVAPNPTGLGALLVAIGAGTFMLLLIALELRKPVEKRWRGRAAYSSLLAMWGLLLVLPVVFGYSLIAAMGWGIPQVLLVISLVGLTLTLVYDLVTVPLALYHRRRGEAGTWVGPAPFVSVIVPAFNEEKVLASTLETLLEVDYPRKEILVVDDGSSDTTARVASRFESQGVKTLRRPNGGKAAALNLALFFAKGDIIVTVDADSLVTRRALWGVVQRFQDPRVKAVCGNVKVLNRSKLLTRCQALEYITDINLTKRAFDVFGSAMVVPGVLGAFRRGVLRDGGDYDPDTLTEDFDTTIKALKAGSVVQATTRAIAYTEAPESLGDFYRQRLRWYAGTFQTLLKHRDVLLNRRYGFLSGLGFPYLLLSMVLIPIAGLAALLAGVLAVAAGLGWEFLLLLLTFVMLEVFYDGLAVALDGEDPRLLFYSPLFVLGYRTLRDVIRLKALGDVIFHRPMGWGRATRLGRARELGQRSPRSP